MCLAIPGKIESIKQGVATVDYGFEKRSAQVVAGDFKKGDYVIVSGQIVIEKVPARKAVKWLKVVENATK